jgi:CRISPR-associated protein Csm4
MVGINMENLKISIRLKSSINTPFHSDTLWGHICWALRYQYGESELDEFLTCYRRGEPPLIISNAFPKGYLPYPVLAPIDKTKAMRLVDRFWRADRLVMGVSALKSLSKTPWISREILRSQAEEEISNELLIGLLLDERRICPVIADYLPKYCPNKYNKDGKIACSFISFSKNNCPQNFRARLGKNMEESAIIYHSKINRLSGTTIEQSLFTTKETFFGGEEFEAYCKIGNDFSIDKLRNCLEFINSDGYGKKKSTGKGNIQCTIESGHPGISATGANAFMTLSNYMPAATDSSVGYYRVFTKYGKLGGHFANSPISGIGSPMPFKYPLVMFEAGSVFKKEKEIINYGRVVEGVHPIGAPNIIHYGIAYPLPLNVRF